MPLAGMVCARGDPKLNLGDLTQSDSLSRVAPYSSTEVVVESKADSNHTIEPRPLVTTLGPSREHWRAKTTDWSFNHSELGRSFR